jgi:hypothetical protein
MTIVGLDIQMLAAPNDRSAYWVSNIIVPRANELLVQIRTRDGVEGSGFATSYTSAEPMIQDAGSRAFAQRSSWLLNLTPTRSNV